MTSGVSPSRSVNALSGASDGAGSTVAGTAMSALATWAARESSMARPMPWPTRASRPSAPALTRNPRRPPSGSAAVTGRGRAALISVSSTAIPTTSWAPVESAT